MGEVERLKVLKNLDGTPKGIGHVAGGFSGLIYDHFMTILDCFGGASCCFEADFDAESVVGLTFAMRREVS